jgi:hypothetical protein
MKQQYIRKTFIFGIYLISVSWAYAQDSVNTSGGNASGSGGSASYSVGQAVYNVRSNIYGNIVEGVQQPFEIMVLSNPGFSAITLTVSPNPTTGILYLTSDENFDLTDVNYGLFDSTGKVLKQKIPVTQNSESIQIANIPQGFYILTVSRKNQVLKSFKIIKK